MIIGLRIVQIVFLALIVFGLSPRANLAQKSPESVALVKASLNAQVDAWNAGDLEKAMAYYWNSPEMLWISKKGTEKGYKPVLEGYRKDFSDKTKMGVYSYEPLHIEALSKTSVFYVFRWKIELNGKRQMGGVSSQVWKKIKGRWRITAEHAS